MKITWGPSLDYMLGAGVWTCASDMRKRPLLYGRHSYILCVCVCVCVCVCIYVCVCMYIFARVLGSSKDTGVNISRVRQCRVFVSRESIVASEGGYCSIGSV